MNNVKEFDLFEITEDEQKEAAGYVCDERVIYYLFKMGYSFDKYCLLYVDRFLGWHYGESEEPIIPTCNQLAHFLQDNIYENVSVKKEDIEQQIRCFFEKGYKLIVPMWIEHFSDGTLYITPVVLEGMDDNGYVYYTKHTQVDRSCCHPLKLDEFIAKLPLNEEGFLELSIVKTCNVLHDISKMNTIEAYQFIFRDLYGYKMENGKILKNNKVLEFDLSGFVQFIESLQKEPQKILTGSGIPKHQQFRLYVHINNKIRPIQNILNLVLNDQQVDNKLSKQLKNKIEIQFNKMNDAISSVHKFASLFFQKPNEKNLGLYIKSIQYLKEIMPEYQLVNLIMTDEIIKMSCN